MCRVIASSPFLTFRIYLFLKRSSSDAGTFFFPSVGREQKTERRGAAEQTLDCVTVEPQLFNRFLTFFFFFDQSVSCSCTDFPGKRSMVQTGDESIWCFDVGFFFFFFPPSASAAALIHTSRAHRAASPAGARDRKRTPPVILDTPLRLDPGGPRNKCHADKRGPRVARSHVTPRLTRLLPLLTAPPRTAGRNAAAAAALAFSRVV